MCGCDLCRLVRHLPPIRLFTLFTYLALLTYFKTSQLCQFCLPTGIFPKRRHLCGIHKMTTAHFVHIVRLTPTNRTRIKQKKNPILTFHLVTIYISTANRRHTQKNATKTILSSVPFSLPLPTVPCESYLFKEKKRRRIIEQCHYALLLFYIEGTLFGCCCCCYFVGLCPFLSV